MNCRFCQTPLNRTFLDLGFAPPSNAYLEISDLNKPELYYPLKLKVCSNCFLVQTEDYARADELFRSDYAYFSSVSSSWLTHARNYCDMIVDRFKLDRNSFVVEIAANDGYLLRNFVEKQIPCLGIEPTASTADAAEKLGIPILRKFFGTPLANTLLGQKKQADLIIGNNVFAHVPDINDFTAGISRLLKPKGVVTLEFPHLQQLIEHTQFDTVYHEHFSYLSLNTVNHILTKHGLTIVDVEHLPTHGGSLRVYGMLSSGNPPISKSVSICLNNEKDFGLLNFATYDRFQDRVDSTKNTFLSFLIEQKRLGKKIAAYGAAAKGNTLINYAGVKPDLLPFVCDAAPSKQGKFLPGSHIPIMSPDHLAQLKPDFVIILPWNLANEIRHAYRHIRDWGGRFVTTVPDIVIYEQDC